MTLVGAPRQGHTEGMTQALHQTDHHVRAAITDTWAWTPSNDTDRIGVAETDGAVKLSVPSDRARLHPIEMNFGRHLRKEQLR